MTSESIASSAMLGLSRRCANAASMRLRPVNDGWYEISVSLASCSSVIFSTSASGSLGAHHDHVLPFVAGQRDEVLGLGQRLGGQADVGGAVQQHLHDLVGRALVQAHLHLREAAAQLRDRLGQDVARLRVRGGDRQRAGVLLRILLADALHVGDLAQDHVDRLEHLLAGLGDAAQALAVAHEQVDAQFLLELEDGLGDAGLRREQRLRGLGQVQVAAHGLLHETELVQVHVADAVQRAVAGARSPGRRGRSWRRPARR